MGFSVTTTVLAAAGTYDLTTLATAKDELSIASNNSANDAWLSGAISRASEAIADEVGRVMLPEYVRDTFDIEQDAYPSQTPGGFAQLRLTRWPVLAIASVAQTTARGTTQVLVEGVDYRLDAEAAQLLRLNTFTGVGTLWEAIPVTVSYVGGYGAAVQEVATVSGTAPYRATVSQAATFSCDQSVSFADGRALVAVTANPAAGQYSVNAGVYEFNAADAGKQLSFAYATRKIPGGLEEIALQVITGRYRAKGRDPSLVERDTDGIGRERFWFGGAPGQKGAFPPNIAGALERYSVPVVA
ncbi:hypothetical protein BH10PSE14_BH10PSE14_06720 [soil metagenome]